MLATAGAAYWALNSDQFGVNSPALTGDLRYTSADALLAAAGVGSGAHPNVFKLRSGDMERAIASFPSISDAHVDIGLPNRVDISVTERQPVFAIRRGTDIYLVDEAGEVLATADDPQVAALGIPVVDDRRATLATPLEVGSTIDPLDLAVILELGAVTPAVIDSHAASLDLSVADDGFVIAARPAGWQAIFGNYTPNLRPTEIIPRQVQCLRALLEASESDVRTVYLAPLEDGCGTYLPVATPVVATPAPSKSR